MDCTGPVSTVIEDPQRAVAKIFSSAVAAVAISAAWETGLLEELHIQKDVNVSKFVAEKDLDSGSMLGLVTALVVAHVVKRNNDTITAGPLLEETYRAKSLFHWFTVGSGGLFSRTPQVLLNRNRAEACYERDSVAIAYACRDINQQHFDPAFWTAMDELNYKPLSVVDIGSGDGERLMQIVDRYPNATGIGIDIAGPAVEVATAESLRRGLGNKLSFIEGDACNMDARGNFDKVDLLTCFMMGHDFWPRENCITTLQRLREVFPKTRRFLLGDTARVLLDCAQSKHAVSEDDVPVFTLGFEFGHALMGTYIPTVEEWEGVFDEGGWRCVKKHMVDSVYPSIIFELEHT